MYGYIYKITNLVNNKFYIGQHKSKKFDKTYFGSGNLIQQAIKKYGLENFKVEILYRCKSLKEMCDKEIYYIKKYDALNKKIAYNISKGGEFGDSFTGQPLDKKEAMRKKMSESRKRFLASPKGIKYRKETSEKYKGKPAWNKGKKMGKEFCEKMKTTHPKGYFHHTEETKRKISKSSKLVKHKSPNKKTRKKISNSVKKLWQDPKYKAHQLKIRNSIKRVVSEKQRKASSKTMHKIWNDPKKRRYMIAKRKGFHHTEETKTKIREHNKTKKLWQDPEYRKKMSKALTGRKMPKGFKRTENQKIQISNKLKLLWQNPNYRQMMLMARKKAS